ncbi:DUF4190 domain-containing protein [Candidatus Woesearchaeota archaeon]|nr:DUF4190 domain-containing protein [Candidatus Woesearchaeota archaeon]
MTATTSPNKPSSPGSAEQAEKTPGIAIAALILGISSFIPLLGFLTGITGIILGVTALRSTTHTQQSGKGLATAGIILGLLGITLHIVAVAFLVNLVQDVQEDPAGLIKRMPGVEAGCSFDDPLTCDGYGTTDNNVTITLSASNNGIVTSIEGALLQDGKSLEELAGEGEGSNECSWEGAVALTPGTTRDVTITCGRPVTPGDLIILSATYDQPYPQEVAGYIIQG